MDTNWPKYRPSHTATQTTHSLKMPFYLPNQKCCVCKWETNRWRLTACCAPPKNFRVLQLQQIGRVLERSVRNGISFGVWGNKRITFSFLPNTWFFIFFIFWCHLVGEAIAFSGALPLGPPPQTLCPCLDPATVTWQVVWWGIKQMSSIAQNLKLNKLFVIRLKMKRNKNQVNNPQQSHAWKQS